jgi:formylglycine-generating enzyme required for sulfatase activity
MSTGSRSPAASSSISMANGARCQPSAWRATRSPIVQYQTFIDAGGYREKRWWTDLQRPEPEASHWPQANRPRTNVNWYEAVAFCRWLSAQLGDELRLPTEEEWERAARGRDGRQYPWGNAYESGRANINETWDKMGEWNLQQTTAVGVYPHGTSSEGVLDLSGNVWEWCLNRARSPRADSRPAPAARRACCAVARGTTAQGSRARLATQRGPPWLAGASTTGVFAWCRLPTCPDPASVGRNRHGFRRMARCLRVFAAERPVGASALR